MTYPSDWDEESDNQLCALWYTQLSTREIGLEIGGNRSKNAVLGRARRIGLPTREAAQLAGPRSGEERRPLPKPRGATIEGLASLQAELPAAPAMPKPAPKPKPVEFRPQASKPCCWPLNDGRPWRFCEAPAEPGRPYCKEHRKMAKGSRVKSAAMEE